MAARQPVLHASLKVYAYMYISLCYLYKKKPLANFALVDCVT